MLIELGVLAGAERWQTLLLIAPWHQAEVLALALAEARDTEYK